MAGNRRKWPDDWGRIEDRGIRCPNCACGRSEVHYTRDTMGNRKMRRRICLNCGKRYTTYEKA